jgi:PEGA domain-containing protein
MTTPIEPRPPLILDDDWEPPPRPRRAPVFVIAALVVVCVTFVTIRAYVWAQNQTAPVDGGSAPPPRGMLWYPDDSEFGLPARPQAAPPHAPVAPPARPSPRSAVSPPARAPRRARPLPPGQLSVNSTPWSVLWLDGHVVGNTPQLGIRVTPGRHLLVFARDGFESHSTWVTVEPSATVKMTGITLRPITP